MTPASTDVSPHASSSPSSDLSSGAKIAIGLAVPLGSLVIAFAIAFIWLRRKRLLKSKRPIDIGAELDRGANTLRQNEAAEALGSQRYEIQAREDPVEAFGDDALEIVEGKSPVELEGKVILNT